MRPDGWKRVDDKGTDLLRLLEKSDPLRRDSNSRDMVKKAD